MGKIRTREYLETSALYGDKCDGRGDAYELCNKVPKFELVTGDNALKCNVMFKLQLQPTQLNQMFCYYSSKALR